MKTPPPALVPLIAVAADLRAAGFTWDKVGAEVHRSAEACRKWPREYPRIWADAFGGAADRVIADAGSEATIALRNLLRSKEERVQLLAARVVLWASYESRKLAGRAAPGAEFVCPPDTDPRLFQDALRVAHIIKDAWYERHPDAAASEPAPALPAAPVGGHALPLDGGGP